METHEEGRSASPRGGRYTEAQSRPRLLDGDRAPCSTDHQAERMCRQEPRDDDVDRAPFTTCPPKDPGLGPLGESRAAPGRRISFKILSGPSRSPEQALPSKPPDSAESVEQASSARGRSASASAERVARVATQALGYAVLTPHSWPLPSKPPDCAESVEPAFVCSGPERVGLFAARGARKQPGPGFAVLTPHSCPLPSKPPGFAESVEAAAAALDRRAPDNLDVALFTPPSCALRLRVYLLLGQMKE